MGGLFCSVAGLPSHTGVHAGVSTLCSCHDSRTHTVRGANQHAPANSRRIHALFYLRVTHPHCECDQQNLKTSQNHS